ncbi:hypothetical protein GCM10010109_02050 [Actinoplanes campanulatus]|nr:hypothetical protein GCM10010109_02050 [Actinoplanes campanulatus]GID34260.1 hypothetical protein Aca09nite_07660 [Actinoplanes campanulatus]
MVAAFAAGSCVKSRSGTAQSTASALRSIRDMGEPPTTSGTAVSRGICGVDGLVIPRSFEADASKFFQDLEELSMFLQKDALRCLDVYGSGQPSMAGRMPQRPAG